MNILITGGLGYVGGRIADFLARQRPDSRIFLTTRGQSGNAPSWATGFTLFDMDVLDEDSIARCLSGTNFDTVIHLAALNEIQCIHDPDLALRVNTHGTLKLLEQTYRAGIERFIYFSTFHVYRKNEGGPITERTATGASHPYASTHRAAEDWVSFYRDYRDMETVIFRLSNGYGYPMDANVNRWTLVFNDLCKQAVTTGRLVLNSSGKQHRDFIALTEVARVVEYFLFYNSDWQHGIFNLGQNCSMSILDVAHRVAEIYKAMSGDPIGSITTQADRRQGDCKPVRFCVDKLLATGFRFKDVMQTEIEKTIQLCESMVGQEARVLSGIDLD